MKLRVRVFGYLRTFCNRKTSHEIVVDLPDNSTTHGLLQVLRIPEKEDVIFVVNNVPVSKEDRVLRDDDAVMVYPFLGGG